MSRQDVNIRAFTGMNNLKQHGRFWADAEHGVAEPRILLNADVSVSGGLVERTGTEKVIDLPGAHSLWAGRSCMLCVADQTLYRILQGQAIAVSGLGGSEVPLSYEEVEGKVYLSNKYGTGVYDPATGNLEQWGIALPPGPMLLSGAGGLPAGIYHVTMTQTDGQEMSGNGPVAEIQLEEPGGIEIMNRPSGAVVWVTDANEGIFYAAGTIDRVVDLPTFEPLPSFMCSPPPPMDLICYAFGRMWGFHEDRLLYSEPFKPGWFKPTTNYIPIDGEGTIIAQVPTGLFIGTKKSTRFLGGTTPEEMVQSDAGAPSIPGTLSYANNLPELGDVLGTPEKGYVDVPVWRTTEGIVAGNASGRLFNLSKHKLQMGAPSRGASLYRTVGGVFQYITTAPASGGDQVTKQMFKSGTMDISSAGFADYATCEVRRGGKLI